MVLGNLRKIIQPESVVSVRVGAFFQPFPYHAASLVASSRDADDEDDDQFVSLMSLFVELIDGVAEK